MKKNSLTRKIGFILFIKVLLIICLWKFCFSHPLSALDRQVGIQAIFAAPSENSNGK